jgi:small GTP-binding protein
MSITQKNKATTTHLGSLKAKLCALRRELLNPDKPGAKKIPGFEVQRYGNSRVALIGFPSVGKSSLLTALTGVESEAADYEFTTLTCIPGVIHMNDAKIQLLDLPGIIMGAAQGKGRGRQVIATARSADMIIMVLDATKDDAQRNMLTKELEDVGIRLNKQRPKISVTRTKTGGLKFNATVPLTILSYEMCYSILQTYKLFNVDVVIHEDASIDDFIDILEESGTAPRVYMKCIYVYNKIDMLSIKMVDDLARQPHTLVVSVRKKLNLDGLLSRMWQELALVRVYTKKKGMFPDFSDPLVMTPQRGNRFLTVENAVGMLHKSLLEEFKAALVWGTSVRSSPQICGRTHELQDEDVMQIQKMTPAERARKAHGKKTGQTLAGTNIAVDPKAARDKKEKAPLKT